jgi:hypothetical protein
MRLALLLVPSLILAGCTLLKEPEIREVTGPTDGYMPTAAFLKLSVKRDDGGAVLLDFDRRDWYASKIAEMVDTKQIPFVSAQGMPRLVNEYVAETVIMPSELAKLRYDEMGATSEQRMTMDQEYTALLERYLASVPDAPEAPQVPTVLVPTDALP